MFQKFIVAAAFYDRFTGSIGVCLKNDSGIVLQFAEHTKIKTDIFFVSVDFKNLINLFQTFYCFDRTDIVCQAARFCKNFCRAKEMRQFQKSFFQIFRDILAADKIFYAKVILLRNQRTEIFFCFGIQSCVLQK